MHQFPKFTLAWNSTCFRQFLCPSSGVYSLYIWHWYVTQVWWQLSSGTSGSSVPSWSCLKAVYKPVWHIPVPSVQRINSWWWAEELPETCRVSRQNKFGRLIHLIGFIIKKSLCHVCSCWLTHYILTQVQVSIWTTVVQSVKQPSPVLPQLSTSNRKLDKNLARPPCYFIAFNKKINKIEIVGFLKISPYTVSGL